LIVFPEKARTADDLSCGSAIGPPGLTRASAPALVAAGAARAAEPVVYALAGTVIERSHARLARLAAPAAMAAALPNFLMLV
jgi:hypothetical protein